MTSPLPRDRSVPWWGLWVYGVAALASLGVLSPTAEARIAVIRTDDGNLFRGELVQQTSDAVILNVQGINATFDPENIVNIELQDTPEEIYEKRSRGLAKTDLPGRLELAQQMQELDTLRLAKFELTNLNRDFPEHPAVLEELAIVNAKQRLQQTRSDAPTVSDANPPQRLERRGETQEDRFLTRKAINLIKVYEVELAEEPRVEVPKATINSFFQKYNGHRLVPTGRRDRNAFKRLEGHEQLDVLFRVQARDLYDQVEIKQEPWALSKFRRNVNPQYVARYFAPTFGHGQIDGLSLFNQRPQDEAEAYTNFYRLSQFRVNGNPMIDRASPELSLLLQWGLDRESARFPAPDVPGWRPMFRSLEDSDFRRYVEWIDSLFKDDLDYGIAPLSDDVE